MDRGDMTSTLTTPLRGRFYDAEFIGKPPSVTEADIAESIERCDYHLLPETTITVCVMRLRNGYNVIGYSACADPSKFNRDLGESIAYADARRQVWPLLGFLLHEHTASNEAPSKPATEDFTPGPGVGQLVWYLARPADTQLLAATVACVINERLVNLSVLREDGSVTPVQAVPFCTMHPTRPIHDGHLCFPR